MRGCERRATVHAEARVRRIVLPAARTGEHELRLSIAGEFPKLRYAADKASGMCQRAILGHPNPGNAWRPSASVRTATENDVWRDRFEPDPRPDQRMVFLLPFVFSAAARRLQVACEGPR